MQQLLENTDAILAQLAASDDQLPLSASGYPCAQFDGAVRQSVDESRMSADFIIVTNTGKPNRNGSIVQLTEADGFKGMDTTAFEKSNPIVLFDHGIEFMLPIGTARDPDTGVVVLDKSPKRITSTIFFSRTLPEAEVFFGLVAEGALNCASVQFMPHKALLESAKDLPKKEREAGVMRFGSGRFWKFLESELWEFSLVKIPGDAGAIRKFVERGSVNGAKVTPRLRPMLQSIAETSQRFGVGFDADDFAGEPCGVSDDDAEWDAYQPYAPMSEAERQSLDDDDDAEFWAAMGGDGADAEDDGEFSKAVSALSATCDRVEKRLRHLSGDTT